MTTIKGEWESYRREVVAPDAGPVQVDETWKAFYAGAVAVWRLMMKEDAPTKERVEAVEAEFREFRAGLERRRFAMRST